MEVQINLIRRLAWSFHYTTGYDYEELFSEASVAYAEARNNNNGKAKETTVAYIYMKNRLTNYVMKQREGTYFDDTVHNKQYAYGIINHQYFFEVRDELSQKANELIDLILRNPHRFIDGSSPKKARGRLFKYLRFKGWKHADIWATFKEIEQVID